MPGMFSVLGTKAHAHGQADTFPYHSSVPVNALPILGLFIVNDLVGKRLTIILQIGGIVSKVGNLPEHSSPALSNRSINSSHITHSLSSH